MDSGRCRRCGRAFTAGEIAGLGILRPRDASKGGPVVEFSCPSCRAVHRLVPHGQGRYAQPGAPPPPPPTEAERRLPWEVSREPGEGPPDAPGVAAEAPSGGPAPPAEPPPPAPAAPPRVPRPPSAAPPTPWEVLGVGPTASRSEVDDAFRAKALQCHPDKVAHLAPEFRDLAERKFRELLTAYEALVGDKRPSTRRDRASAE
jgi:hypothetical protein